MAGHDQLADVWSLGITAIELAIGEAPYARLKPAKVIMLIMQGSPPKLPEDRDFSPEFRAFVEACLVKDPAHRPSIEELFKNHKAFLDKA
jgi:serine/threonine protein kinase